MVKNLPANARDTRDVGLIPGLGRSPGGGNGNPLQYSCLENLMDRGEWQQLRCSKAVVIFYFNSFLDHLILNNMYRLHWLNENF